jgi:hypothetical protein
MLHTHASNKVTNDVKAKNIRRFWILRPCSLVGVHRQLHGRGASQGRCRHSISLFSFFSLEIGRWSPYWVHAALRPCIDLLYLSRVIVRMEKLVEWNVVGRGNRSTRRKPAHLPDPGANPGRRSGKLATNRFSYGAAPQKHSCKD